jgi:hypothetical protein
VNNLIFGEMYVEHVGTMTVRNVTNGNVCLVEFKKRGWTGKGAFEIEGYAYESMNSKDKKAKLYGKWIESMSINYQDREEVIWVANPLPPESPSMYFFTYFTLKLNFLPPSLKKHLPPTDSRFRPDQRALENGDLVKAAEEKVRLEEKQRKMRKDREMRGQEYQSRYFMEAIDEESGEKYFKYIRDYWADREKGDWSHLEDIF